MFYQQIDAFRPEGSSVISRVSRRNVKSFMDHLRIVYAGQTDRDGRLAEMGLRVAFGGRGQSVDEADGCGFALGQDLDGGGGCRVVAHSAVDGDSGAQLRGCGCNDIGNGL